MASASLIVLCLGAQAAAAQVQVARSGAPRRGHPRPARESLFTLGRRWLRRWTYPPAALTPPWRLDALVAPARRARWRAVQGQRVLPLPRAAPPPSSVAPRARVA